MKKYAKKILKVLAIIALIWILLTIWAEAKGKKAKTELGEAASFKRALIVYDPDPFYNLDEQVCKAFGNTLARHGWHVTVATVAATKEVTDTNFHLYVFCANTYNWSPDWAITGYIKKHQHLQGKRVVAITLGAGSTALSKRIFEKKIKAKQVDLIDSKTFWLLRPNDENRSKEKNVQVAKDMVNKWAEEIVIRLK